MITEPDDEANKLTGDFLMFFVGELLLSILTFAFSLVYFPGIKLWYEILVEMKLTPLEYCQNTGLCAAPKEKPE